MISSALLVEDEPLIAMSAQLMLEHLGIPTVFVAHTVREALSLANDIAFDLALLDYNLKRENSVPVAERLREQGARIAFASGAPIDDLPAALANVPVIGKPYTIDDLRFLLAPQA